MTSGIYLLNAELTSKRGEVTEKNKYQLVYHVNHIHEIGNKEYFYDPKLKINVENKAKQRSVYQIDIQLIELNLSKRLTKASDFIRRTMYVYDWIEICVNPQGKVISIENKEELKATWKEIRKRLLNDYNGKATENYLSKIDKQLNVDGRVLQCIYSYLNFGLIFPLIPYKHKADWTSCRDIVFSEYDEPIVETVVFSESTEKSRKYNISLKAHPEQKMKVHSVNGYYLVSEEDIFPTEVRLSVSYEYDSIMNTWMFKLDKY